MLRRFTAVLIFHFLLCVGISAAGLNVPAPVPQWPDVVAQSAHQDPGIPGAISDVNEHALMDNKDDLPDQLEVIARSNAGSLRVPQAIPLRATRSLSAGIAPPHRPPIAS